MMMTPTKHQVSDTDSASAYNVKMLLFPFLSSWLLEGLSSSTVLSWSNLLLYMTPIKYQISGSVSASETKMLLFPFPSASPTDTVFDFKLNWPVVTLKTHFSEWEWYVTMCEHLFNSPQSQNCWLFSCFCFLCIKMVMMIVGMGVWLMIIVIT